MITNGYFSISRKITEDTLWKIKPFDKMHAWIDLVRRANYSEKKMFINNKEIVVERGQLSFSQVTLANEWGWSRCKLQNFFHFLQKRGSISYSTPYNATTLITIMNYDTYQNVTNTKRQQTITKQGMTQAHSKAQENKENKVIINNKYNIHEMNLIFEAYKASININSQLTEKSKKHINARLKNYTIDQLKEAIRRFSNNKWRMKNNSDKPMSWFFRSDEQIETFLLLKQDKISINSDVIEELADEYNLF